MARKISFIFAFLILPLAASCELFKEAVSLYPKITLGGAYAGGNLKDYAAKTPYKSANARLDLPLYLVLMDNIYADINYYIRADYNNNQEDDTFYTHKFQKASLNYKNDFMLLRAGRQDYQSRNKDFIIYYGHYNNIDSRPPTAIEGVRHTLETKYISYDLLGGKEVKSSSLNYDNSLVYGGSLLFNLANVLSLDTFYYRRETKDGLKSLKISVFGAGLEFKQQDSFAISLYGALNHGDEATKIAFFTQETEAKGYAFNAKAEFKGDNNFAKTKYAFNLYYASPVKDDSLPFKAVAQNLDMGFVFGGSDMANINLFHDRINDNPTRKNKTDFIVYSLRADLFPHDIKGFNAGAQIYNFMFSDKDKPYTSIGSEVDINLSYAKGDFEVNLIYGLFIAGNAIISKEQQNMQNKSLSKIGLSTSFMFSL